MTSTSEGLLSAVDDHTTELVSTAVRRQLVIRTTGIFALDNPALGDAVADRRPLVVWTPSVERLYGDELRSYFSVHCPSGFECFLLRRTEESKTLGAVTDICEFAAEAGLRRTSPMVAVGGGVCTDLVGIAAAVFRRGVPHLKVPTTLIGLVDAGIGTKNAVNHAGRKSILGTFHPPEASILDLNFVATLPRRHVVNGMAEIAKVALVIDERLFDLLESSGSQLVDSRLREPALEADALVHRAVHGMLAQLAGNVYEWGDYRRAMDFGHTFSPYIEVASEHEVLHGEAVAMDMALSLCLSSALGLMDDASRDRALRLLLSLGLDLAWCGIDVHKLWESLQSICEHRAGHLNLCLPTGIGIHTFVDLPDIDVTMLRRAHDHLAAVRIGRVATEEDPVSWRSSR
ncbi:3-dehydroquinate synthase family protein [Streptomyces sp. 7N604]|uniref:3-dehydroquinate synthase family protein n=1 Tax=Streptomyces sp. 7N604 TaxID=3457415 RepID=UPI003FD5DF67